MQTGTAFPTLKEIWCFVQLRDETRSLERREVRGREKAIRPLNPNKYLAKNLQGVKHRWRNETWYCKIRA